MAGVEGADETADADFAEVLVDPHFGELRAERVHREALLFFAGFRLDFRFDERMPGLFQQRADRHAAVRADDQSVADLQRVARLAAPAGSAIGDGQILDLLQ